MKTLLDYLIWGFIGTPYWSLPIYCIAVLIDKKELVQVCMFTLVCLGILWQMIMDWPRFCYCQSSACLSFFQSVEPLCLLVVRLPFVYANILCLNQVVFSTSYLALRVLLLLLCAFRPTTIVILILLFVLLLV